MIQLSLDFPREDLEAVHAQINRMINLLGIEPKEAARRGMVAALKALQASTRKSPRIRRIVRDRVARIDLRTGKARKLTAAGSFLVERWKPDGTKDLLQISAPSLAEAKRHPAAKIRYSGLAHASWGWSMKRLFPNQAVHTTSLRPRRRFLDVSESGTGRDYSATVSNSLDYVSRAFNSSRGPAVATAMRRAANTMKGRIDQRLKGALR